MYRHRHDIRRFLEANEAVVAVIVEAAKGSTPRDDGAWMLVSPNSIFRTIGGGNLELMAVDAARRLLADGNDTDTLSIALGPDIGQCCGGHVALKLQRLGHDDQTGYIEQVDHELSDLPNVLIFGAGHVGNCLAEALALLPVHPILVDTRKDELDAAPAGVETRLTAVPESVVRTAPQASAFVVLTHDHSLDFLIVQEALQRRDALYVGMIGSKTKRTMFARWFEKNSGAPDELDALICPIGNQATGDKRPEVIAGFVAAEIIAHLTKPSTKQPGQRESVKLGENA